MPTCTDCKATVKWIVLEVTGRTMPVDAIPDHHATVAVRVSSKPGQRFSGYIIGRKRPLEEGYQLHRAHRPLCERIGRKQDPKAHRTEFLDDQEVQP